MDKKTPTSALQQSQSCSFKLSRSKLLKINNIPNNEILSEETTQEELENLESTRRVNNKNAGKCLKLNDKLLNNVGNIDANLQSSLTGASHYVMRKIEEPIGNDTLNKGSNQQNNKGFWNFSVMSNYVMDGIQKVYPTLISPLKMLNNDGSEVYITNTKTSLEIDSKTNKESKEEENNMCQSESWNNKSKSTSGELNKITHGYLPNWDTLSGATSNFVETTTTVVGLTTHVLKTATEMGIKNIKYTNKKVYDKNTCSSQVPVHSNNNSCKENFKTAADYDYIDLVTAHNQINENDNNNNKS